MKAIGIYKAADKSSGTIDTLEWVDVPKPSPAGRDILVKVRAVATNPVDYKVLAGAARDDQKLEHPKITGWDAAGVVESIGEQASLFKPGDEVFFAGAIQRQGCFAEYVLVDERIVGRKPKNLKWTEAATVPLCWLTAWEGLMYQLNIPHDRVPASSILIVGAAGGVGSFAIQIAKQVLKLEVIATASREETVKHCKSLGADYVISHKEDLRTQLKAIGKYETLGYIFDCFGLSEELWRTYVEVIRPFGRICSIVPTVKADLGGAFFSKSLTVSAALMFTRPRGSDIEAQHDMLEKACQYLEEGLIKPTIKEEFPFAPEGLKTSLALHMSSSAIGKNALFLEE